MMPVDFTATPLTATRCTALLADPDPYYRAILASHPQVSPETLDQLSRDSAWIVRRAVAQAEPTATDTLDRLAHDTHPLVAKTARARPTLSLTTFLTVLALSDTSTTAMHPLEARLIEATPAEREILTQDPFCSWMAEHPHPKIRRLLARYAWNLSGDLLDRLLHDPTPSVVAEAVAGHPLSVSQQYGLWYLCPEPIGAEYLASAYATPLDPALVLALATHSEPLVRFRVAARQDLDATVLALLWADPDARVRAQAALAVEYRRPSPDQLQTLLTDPDPEVRASVAKALPDESPLHALSHDPDTLVRQSLARRDPTTWSIQQRLLRDLDAVVPALLALWTDQPALWDACRRHPDALVREALASNPAYQEAINPASAALVPTKPKERADALDLQRWQAEYVLFDFSETGDDPWLNTEELLDTMDDDPDSEF